MTIVGVLLAAGRGRRLGGNKQLTPLPSSSTEETLVESSFDHIEGACDEMVVVLDHKQDEIEMVLRPRIYTTIRSDADAALSASIQIGLEAALQMSGVECILLQLGDHPQVKPSTIEDIIAFSHASGSAVVPRHQGRNGHPIAIPTALAGVILRADLSTGLADWFRMDAARRKFLDVNDPSVLLNIDTPEDLLRASRSINS